MTRLCAHIAVASEALCAERLRKCGSVCRRVQAVQGSDAAQQHKHLLAVPECVCGGGGGGQGLEASVGPRATQELTVLQLRAIISTRLLVSCNAVAQRTDIESVRVSPCVAKA